MAHLRPRTKLYALPHLVLFRAFFLANRPAGQLQEHIIEAWLLHLNGFDAFLEIHDHARHEFRAGIDLKMIFAIDLLNTDAIAVRQILLQLVVAGNNDDIAADAALEIGGAVECLNLSVVDDRDAAAVFGLIEVMRGHENRNADFLAELADVVPDGAAGLRIEAGGRFVEEQHLGMMHQAAGDFEAALHAAGKSPHDRFAAIGQGDHFEHLGDPLHAFTPRDVVKHGVKDQIFLGGEAIVERRVLKNHADRLANLIRFRDHVKARQPRRSARRFE